MNRVLLTAAVVSLAFLQIGCRSKQERLVEDQIDLGEDLLDIMKGITDEASAKAAVPELEKLKKQAEELAKEGMEVMKDLTPEEAIELMKKYEDEMSKLDKELKAERKRIMANEQLKEILADKLPD